MKKRHDGIDCCKSVLVKVTLPSGGVWKVSVLACEYREWKATQESHGRIVAVRQPDKQPTLA